MSSTQPSPYPGNAALPKEVREKILSTFRHTLNLYHEGKLDDCLIGCDFILKMDPRFAPARQLIDKTRNPRAAVDVAELEAIVKTTPTRQERVGAGEPDRLLVRAVESYNARDFDAAIAAADQVLAVLPGNRDALEILEKASSKKAAAPLFDTAKQRAINALEVGQSQQARQELQRMRDLDADHPSVALLENRIGSAPASPPGGGKTAGPGPRLPDASRPFGAETREPQIAFDDGATMSIPLEAPSVPTAAAAAPASDLDALSLDSLSLDLPTPSGQQVLPPESPATLRGGPLEPTPPGSPADMWSEAPGNLEEAPLSPALAEPAPSLKPSLAPPEDEDSEAGEREIAALIKQGDEAARKGDRQQAIEVWSRIFLIDINNGEAVSRIEKARQEMAEGNRRIADGLKAGRDKFDAGELEAARELFLQVLAADENDQTARFYIDRIEEEMARAASPGPATPGTPATGPFALPAPARTPTAPGIQAAPSGAKRGISLGGLRLRMQPRILAFAGAFVVLSLAGYLLFLREKTPQPAPGPPAAGSLVRAKQILGTGKIAEGKAELRRVPGGNPDFEEAQKLLAELGTGISGGATQPELPATTPVAHSPAPVPAQSDPARFRAIAETALAEKRYIEAMKNFNLAAPTFRADPIFVQAMAVASEKVAALTPAVKLYNEREYETAIPILWRIYQEDRENQDARSYLLRTYYNHGITQLQNGLPQKAIQSFDEALALDPRDTELLRHRKFAERYHKADPDLMGRIYVRHLNQRP